MLSFKQTYANPTAEDQGKENSNMWLKRQRQFFNFSL